MLDSGVDLHSYTPTVDDMVSIANADLFVYVGGESDEWVEDVKKQMKSDVKTLSLLQSLDGLTVAEEIKEGMEAEEEEGPETDEHVWLSPENAYLICDDLTDLIIELDPEHTDLYRENMEKYQAQISEVDKEFMRITENSDTDILLFGDRFPFRYLCEDYGLDYYAAFAGCSAESEASFETIEFLSKKIDEEDIKHVCVLEGPDHKIADAIILNTNTKDQDIVKFNSIQSVTAQDVQNGVTYISLMKDNVKALEEALK